MDCHSTFTNAFTYSLSSSPVSYQDLRHKLARTFFSAHGAYCVFCDCPLNCFNLCTYKRFAYYVFRDVAVELHLSEYLTVFAGGSLDGFDWNGWFADTHWERGWVGNRTHIEDPLYRSCNCSRRLHSPALSAFSLAVLLLLTWQI